MQVIGLPGRSRETKEWMQRLLASLGIAEPAIAHYRHWDSEIEADVSYEAERLQDQVPELVVAKSLATLIAASAFALYSFRPKAAILIGVPLCNFSPQQLQLLRHLSDQVPTLFVQQSADPGASFLELQSLVRDFGHAEAAQVSGDDHAYANISELVAAIDPWWNRVNSKWQAKHQQTSHG